MRKDVIQQIIKKGDVTGEIIGRLLLANMAEEMESYRETGSAKEAFTQQEFNSLFNYIDRGSYNYHIEQYNHYVTIYNTIRQFFNITSGMIKTAECKIALYDSILEKVLGGVEAEHKLSYLPLIMSEKEYKEKMQEYTDRQKKYKFCYFDIFIYFAREITDYECNRRNYPEKTPVNKELDKLLNKYKKELAKNKELKQIYYDYEYSNDGTEGSFIFKDSLSIMGDKRADFLRELKYNNIQPIKEKLEAYTVKELEEPIEELFIKDILTPEQLEEHFTYTKHDTPPKDVYKFDILNSCCLWDYEPALEDGEEIDKDSKKEIINFYKLLLSEMPELEAYIKKAMKKYKVLKPLYDIDEFKDGFKIFIKWEDIAEAKLFDIYKWPFNELEGDYHRAYNGIAVIKEEAIQDYNRDEIIDSNGNYKTENRDEFLILGHAQKSMIEALLEDDRLQFSQTKANDFYFYIKFIYAYDAFIKIIAKVTKLPVLYEVFSFKMKDIEDDIKDFNRKLKLTLNVAIPKYKNSLTAEESRDKAEKIRERLFNMLPYLDVKKGYVAPQDWDRGEKYITDISHFTGLTATIKPIQILMGEQ